MRRQRLRPLGTVVALLGAATWARAADPFAEGQHVQIREGDTWSSGTVTGHEGRRFHIHYDGSTAADDEWVTVDRLRATDGGSAPPSTLAKAAPRPPAARPKFSIGDKVEAKWGLTYRKAAIVNSRDGWYFINYEGERGDFGREWVESDRVRQVGSTVDPIGYAQPHPYHRGDGPPAGSPTVGSSDAQPSSTDRSNPPNRHGPLNGPDLTRPDSTVGPGDVTLVTPDLTAGRDLEPGAVSAGPVVADPQPSCSPPHMISLNHGPPQFGTEVAMLVTPQGRWAALSFRSFTTVTNVQRIELGSNDAGKVLPLSADVLPLAISPDGKRVITRSDRRGQPKTRWRLDLWDVDRSAPRNLLSFRPFDPAPDGADGVEWAAYVDPTRVLTCSVNHFVTLWQLTDTTVREVYTLAGDGTLRPRLSGGGKYLVAGFGGKLVVCDALTGACVARATDPESPGDGIALRSDLKRLALSGGRRLTVVDLASDQVLSDIGLPATATGTEVGWIGPDLLLVDDRWVYDVARHRFAWEYQPAANPLGESGAGQTVAQTVGNRIWLLMQSGNRITATEGRAVLSSAAVPDPRALIAMKKMDPGAYAVKPGMAVSVEVNVSGGTDADRQRIADRFTKQLRDAGYTVADGQPLKLVAQTRAGESKQLEYKDRIWFGTNGQAPHDETVTATKTVYDLSWQLAGKEVWAISSTSGGVLPLFIFRRSNQSYADVIADLNKPNLGWFLQQHIPREVLASLDAAGTSPLTGLGSRTRNGRPAP